MKKVLIEKNILFGLLLAIFVVIFEVIFFKLSLPAWPAFMVMIFFFVVHEDTKQAPHILVGGLAGILAVVLLGLFTDAVQPMLGHQVAKFMFIGLFVYSIVLLKDFLPYIFNSYAFMFFLVGSLARPTANVSWYVWMGIELIVGSIFILGILGMNRLVNFIVQDR